MPYKVALEYDDFGPRNSMLSTLEEIKDHYPNFKVTLFTVPWEIRFGQLTQGVLGTPITDVGCQAWVDAVLHHQDWMEIALHGLTHKLGDPRQGIPGEMECSYEEAKKILMVAEKMFENQNLKLAKVFKAPQWLISEEAKRAVMDRGYKLCEDHYYNWNLKDDFPKEAAERGDIITGHGHVHDEMGNGMAETLHKVLAIPTDTQFYTLSEIL